jgi:Leucine-rich repeat (LRR) protein
MIKNKRIIKGILAILLAISPLTSIISNVHGNNLMANSFEGARPISEIFPDENLASAVADALGLDDATAQVTAQQLSGVSSINFVDKNIKDLTGFNYFINVTNVTLSNNEISDLSPLKGLLNISILFLDENHISDLTPLQNKPYMMLNLRRNRIADLSPVKASFVVYADEQAIALPNAVTGKPFSFILLDIDGKKPEHTITGGDTVGTYDGNALTWHKSGVREMRWGDNTFSGVVTQTAVDANTIGEYFPDALLAKEIASVLNGNDNIDVTVTEEQLAGIRTLTVENIDVENLEGIQYLTGLTTLNIVNTKVSNISRISGLTALTNLNLGANLIEFISPLASLSNLTTLTLDDNKISDLSALTALSNLRILSLRANQIEDVTPLAMLNGLTNLNLNNNHIYDISTLPQVATTNYFTAMNQTVTLEKTGYVDVPQSVVLLNQFGLNPTTSNKVGEGIFENGVLTWTSSAETELNQLQWIGPNSFQGTLSQKVEKEATIYGLFPDQNLAKAIALHLNNNEANNVVSIPDLKKIERLNVLGHSITDLSGMEHLEGLKNFNAAFNRITDIKPLAELEKLDTLNLNGNSIEDIAPLANKKELVTLSLDSNAITDVSVLSEGFDNLNSFSATGQMIQLPGVFVGMPTQINILDSTNSVPTINFIGTGNYNSESNVLTWSTPGVNYLGWRSADNSFTGFLSQEVNLGNEDIRISDIFPDKNLAQVIANQLGKPDINAVVTSEELGSIEILFALNLGITNIKGFEYLPNVRSVFLVLNQITDLTPLQNLHNLVELNLSNNQIEDVSPLTKMKNLSAVDLTTNNITDVSPLTQMKSLTRIDISYNQISDISSLKDFIPTLRYFAAYGQVITLPEVEVGTPTKISILDINGNVPTLNFVNGQGTYEDGALTWTTVGNNSVRWNIQSLRFAGTINQNVVEAEEPGGQEAEGQLPEEPGEQELEANFDLQPGADVDLLPNDSLLPSEIDDNESEVEDSSMDLEEVSSEELLD